MTKLNKYTVSGNFSLETSALTLAATLNGGSTICKLGVNSSHIVFI